jgi:bifunctional lysine-specific demethylase and histidyl-hydroxylase MINA
MEKFDLKGGEVEPTSSLSSLLSPTNPDDFFREHWDRSPIFVDGPAGRFDHIIGHHDFVRALFDAKLSSPNLRYLQKSIGNREESLDYFLRKKAAWTEPQQMDQLASELNKGTIVYVAIESAVASVAAFCRSLLPDFKSPISINAYFSAGLDASAFDAHFDPQDTFILQLEGEKEWRLWERERVPNPISGYPDAKSIPQPALPADETILVTPGDLLYVPRGTWHWPRSLDDKPSLHLTLTIVMPRPVDILLWLTQEMSKEPDFRAALPFSKHQQGAADIRQALDQAMAYISSKLASPQAAAMATAHMLGAAMRNSPKADDKDEQV